MAGETERGGSTAEDSKGRWLLLAGLALSTLLAMKRSAEAPGLGPRQLAGSQPRGRESGGGGESGGAAPTANTGTANRHHADPAEAESESDRGRHAEEPHHIPAKGWKDVAYRVYTDLDDHRILAVAAGVTFYGLLAMFPAIGALVSLYGLIADASTIDKQLGIVSGVLPGGAIDIISEQVKRISANSNGTLGLTAIIGILISLWSANAGMKAVFDALNVVYDEKEKRSFIMLNVVSLSFTLGAIVILILALGAVVVVPAVLNFVGLSGIGETLLALGRWPLLLLFVIGALTVLYRYGPSRAKAQWSWVVPGSIVATIGWMIGSLLFSWYVSKFGNYNATYGSLGAAIGFMTWMWISSIIILLGAEINAEMEHQTTRDTTEADGKPLGDRGAKMADTVGTAQA